MDEDECARTNREEAEWSKPFNFGYSTDVLSDDEKAHYGGVLGDNWASVLHGFGDQ